MNTSKKSYGFAILLSLFVLQSFSQLRSDFSFIQSSSDEYRTTLEFRKPINENNTIKIAYVYGSSYSPYRLNSRYIYISDSLIIERNQNFNSTTHSLKIGIDKPIGLSLFSYGLDLLVGYKEISKGYHNHEKRIDEEGNAITQLNFPNNNFNGLLSVYETSYINSNYLTTGFQASISLNAPITKRFLVHLFLAETVYKSTLLSEELKHDPYLEFENEKNPNITFSGQIGIGLRYMLKSKKTQQTTLLQSTI